MATKRDESTECKCPKSCGVCDGSGHCPDHCRRKPPESFWALFDSRGAWFSVYDSKVEATYDAVGPRFRGGFTVVEYQRVKKPVLKSVVKAKPRGA